MPDEHEERTDGTDLIDVSDVAAQFEETTAQAPSRNRDYADEESLGEASLEPQHFEGPTIGSLKDRFAAFTIDCMILYIVYWFLMIGYRSIALEQAAGPVPASGTHGLIFHGLFLFIALLYFFLFESVLFATPGKLICKLRVRRSDGLSPSIIACFIRNALLPLDLILAPVLISLMCLEWTRNHLRIGDIVARTMVLRMVPGPRREYALTLDMVPSATARLLAFLIDLVLFIIFVIGYALLLTPEQPIASMLLVVFFPIACILFFMMPEAMFKTSTGKFFFGYTISNEGWVDTGDIGRFGAHDISSIDNNPLGYLTMLLSIRRQRPGDVAAGTVLCKAPRQMKRLIGIIVVVVIVLVILYAGISNRDSFLSSSFKINFLPAIGTRSASVETGPSSRGVLAISEFDFAADNRDAVRKPAIFKPGEKVYLVFAVMGGTKDDGEIWLQEDLTVRYPDGTTGLKLENLIDFREELATPGPVQMTNNIALPTDAIPGRYTVSIVIRDKNSNRQLNEQRFFYVTPPEQQIEASPEKAPESQPPAQTEKIQ